VKLDRMTCPTCHREVAFRLIRVPRVNRGPIPGIRKPVAHKEPLNAEGYAPWCAAGEP
jgi:hypothetical protein